MKFVLSKLDEDDLDAQEYARIKGKKDRLKDKQTVGQLMSREVDPGDPFAKFANPDLNDLAREGYLDDLLAGIKTGKEASVFLGRNSDGLVAVKVYTDLRVRSFKRDQSYREGRFIGDKRVQKAIEQGSRRGQEAHQALWVQEEFRQMRHLHQHGVRVPKAIAVHGTTLIMEFIGDGNGQPASRLSDLKLDREEAYEAFRQAVHNLKLITASGRVHGDYSTFNLLWHRGQAVVIDFPQVMEFGQNPNVQAFLVRDVRSLCKSFQKHGVDAEEGQVLREVRR